VVEGVVQFVSCRELGSARIFTLFVVRDGDDYSETQSEERLDFSTAIDRTQSSPRRPYFGVLE